MADETETPKSEAPENQEPIRRKQDGTFAKGVSGNPGGKRNGPNVKTVMRELWESDPEKYAKRLDELLMQGEGWAWKEMLARVYPEPPKQLDVHSDGELRVGWRKPKKRKKGTDDAREVQALREEDSGSGSP